MPQGQYFGYDFSPEEWEQARWGGLAGGLQGISGADSWADIFMGLGTGFNAGMERSLSGSLNARQEREREEEARQREEMLRQREQAELGASGEMSKWALGRIPDDLEAGLAPEAAFATPQARAAYLTSEAGRYGSADEQRKSHGLIEEAIRRFGKEPTGVYEQDVEYLEELTKQSAKPEPGMTPYQQRTLELREQTLAEARARREEDEQEEIDEDYRSTDMYRRAHGLPLDPQSPASLRERAKQRSVSDTRLQEILGEDYTGIPEIDNANAKAKIQDEWEAEEGMAEEEPEVDMTKAVPPLAPGMPKAGARKAEQPVGSLPTNSAPSKSSTRQNPAAISDQGLQSALQSVGIPLVYAQQFVKTPALSMAFREKWAGAKDERERKELLRRVTATLKAANPTVFGAVR